MELTPTAADLRDALVAVYVPYLRRRLMALSVGPDDELARSLAAGRDWLADELARLLSAPFPQQERGPLEVFQEAVRFPTEVLVGRGIDRVGRDAVAERAIPGDIYDLAPASSSSLGETVWRAHIAWGAEKASTMAGGGM